MEEDIKLLEEMKNNCLTKRDYIDEKAERKAQAIENLINKYKEQERDIRDNHILLAKYSQKNEEQEKIIELALDCLSVWAMCADDEGCFCTVKGKECNVIANEIEGQEHTTCKECLIDYFKKKARTSNDK